MNPTETIAQFLNIAGAALTLGFYAFLVGVVTAAAATSGRR